MSDPERWRKKTFVQFKAYAGNVLIKVWEIPEEEWKGPDE